MVTTRPHIKAAIKEEIKNSLEELHGLEPEDIPWKIFAREAKNGTYEILSKPKDELCNLFYRVESSDAAHLSPKDACRITLIFYYQKHLACQRLHHDDRSFMHVSITLYDFNVFRTQPDNLAALSQAGDIKVASTRSFLSPTAPVHEFTQAEMFKKIITRDASLFYNFKDVNF